MMARDPDVVVFGEDVGYFGGVFRATAGLQKKYGKTRVFDTPISEGGIVGVAVGMGAYGLRRVPRSSSPTTSIPATTRSSPKPPSCATAPRGESPTPMVIRTPYGGGIFGGQTHSQSPEALFTHVAGLKTVIPSTPYDAKGLLIAAIEDNDPVDLLRAQAHLQRPVRRPSRPAGARPGPSIRPAKFPTAITPCRSARRRSSAKATTLTILAYGTMVHVALAAVAEQGIDAEVIDLRTLVPLDIETIEAVGEEDRPLRDRRTRRRAPAASAPSSSPWCRSAASITSKRRSSASPAGTRPIRTPSNGPISRARSA